MVLKFINQCSEFEFPNGVELIQKILIQTSKQKDELEQELRRIRT
jgi:hypothetical protein